MTTSRKSGLLLGICLVVGVLCYALVLPHFLPDQHVQVELDQSEIEQKSLDQLSEIGYQIDDLRPVIGLDDDFDAIQSHIYTLGRSDLNRRLMRGGGQQQPPFYFWQTEWQGEEEDIGDGYFSITLQSGQSIEISPTSEITARFSTDGLLAQFHFSEIADLVDEAEFAEAERVDVQTDILTRALTNAPARVLLDDLDDITHARIDHDSEAEPYIDQQKLILTRDDIGHLGDFFLKNSYWGDFELTRDTVQVGSLEEDGMIERASLVYVSDQANQDYTYEVTLEVTAGGLLLEMDNEYELSDPAAKPFENLLVAYQGFGIALVILILLILFLIRLSNQLLDIRLVVPDAIIFMLIILGMFATEVLTQQTLEWSLQSLAIGGGMIMLSLLGGIAFIPLAATTESLSHQAMPGKLDSLTLLRNGFVFNPKVGAALANGISAGVVLFVLATLLYVINDKAVFDLSDLPRIANYDFAVGGYVMFAALYRGLSYSLIILLPIALFVSSKTANRFIRIAVILIVALIVGGITPETSHGLIDAAYRMMAAIVLVYIIFRYDVITIMTAIFSSSLVIASQLFTLAPVANYSSSVITLLVLGVLVGVAFVGMRRPMSQQQIPDMQPEYLRKLAQQERIRQGHELAREVHQSFLPKDVPQFGDLQIAAHCKAAYDVGGDYYDFFQLSDSRLAVVIGDVSGKGIHAAFYMTLIKGYLQSLSNGATSPSGLIRKIHRLFRENAYTGTFVTMIFGIIDLNEETFTFVRAGHNPLIHLKKNESEPNLYKPDGLAVGMGDESIFDKTLQQQTVTFEPGDTLILFTDGYPESVNQHNIHLGDVPFYKLITTYREEPVQSMVNKVRSEVEEYSKNTHQFDDMTMVVIRRE